MKTKTFNRDEFKAQCILMGLALKEAPELDMDDVAERFTTYHYGPKEYAEARIAVRDILQLDTGRQKVGAGPDAGSD